MVMKGKTIGIFQFLTFWPIILTFPWEIMHLILKKKKSVKKCQESLIWDFCPVFNYCGNAENGKLPLQIAKIRNVLKLSLQWTKTKLAQNKAFFFLALKSLQHCFLRLIFFDFINTAGFSKAIRLHHWLTDLPTASNPFCYFQIVYSEWHW